MKYYKFWINAYSEVDGEYSKGWNDLDSAWNDYNKQMNKVTEDGGEVEFIQIEYVTGFDNRELK